MSIKRYTASIYGHRLVGEGLDGKPEILGIIANAGVPNNHPLVITSGEGWVTFATVEAVANETQADQLTIIEQMTDTWPERDAMLNKRLILRWEHPVNSLNGDMLSAVDGIISKAEPTFLHLRCGNIMHGVQLHDIATAQFVWTNYGKPVDAEPPGFHPKST